MALQGQGSAQYPGPVSEPDSTGQNTHEPGSSPLLSDTWRLLPAALNLPDIPVPFLKDWPVAGVEVILETSLQGRVACQTCGRGQDAITARDKLGCLQNSSGLAWNWRLGVGCWAHRVAWRPEPS